MSHTNTTVVSPRRLTRFVGPDGVLTTENFSLIQGIVDSLNGLKDENDFLFTVIMGIRITVGTASPENVVVGSVGDLFIRTDGGAGTTWYLKESGSETNSGWAGI